MLPPFSPATWWALVGIVLVFCEFFLPGLVIVFFAAGALLTALTTLLGWTPTLSGQLLVFIATSLLSLFLLRRMLQKTFLGRLFDSDEAMRFDVDRGGLVRVVEEIDPGRGTGRVHYQGSSWLARANEKIPLGESVRIVDVDNITLIVERVPAGSGAASKGDTP